MHPKSSAAIAVQPRGLPGPAGMDFKGKWERRTTYAWRAVVLHADQLWFSLRGNTGIEPGSSESDWRLFLPKGVKGDQGETPTLEWRVEDATLQVRRVGDIDWVTLSATSALGQRILSGAADPASGDGHDGDYYLNTTSYVLFGPKASGAWPTPGLVLKGIQGDQGPQGETGPQGPQGEVGETGWDVAWTTGATAEADHTYAFANKRWRAVSGGLLPDPPTADPGSDPTNWEYLGDFASVSHDHDDRYYTKAQLGALDPVVLAGIPAVSDLVPIEGVTPTGYSRATTTSRTDPAGNAQSVAAGVIPIDYDATTGELIGWLLDDADDTWSVPLEATFDVGEGAIYIRGRTGSLTGQKALWVLDDGTSDNYIYLAHSSGNFTLGINAGGTTALNATLGAVATDTDFALAIAWVGTAVKASINGAAFTSHTAAGLPSGLTTERRGEMPAGTPGGLHWAGHAKHFARFARAVDGATLQAMTGDLA
ncbi:hypothetical protein [Afifella sp. YEN Y35]|uniref:hypothetical protein n=1 Tax=Afifella sp. YEN Y35 TaxID=3388337 RepID=UPI0039DF8AA7